MSSIERVRCCWWLLCGVALVAAACDGAGQGGVCPGNEDHAPQDVDEAKLLTFWQGSITVNAEKKLHGDLAEDTIAHAGFSDMYEFRPVDPAVQPYSEACYVVMSQPTDIKRCVVVDCTADTDCPDGFACHYSDCVPEFRSCTAAGDCPDSQYCEIMTAEGDPRHPLGFCMSPLCEEQDECAAGLDCADSRYYHLHVDSVTFGGMAGDDEVLEPDANDLLSSGYWDGFAFEEAAVGVTVASGTGTRDFPGFSVEVPAPTMPRVTRFGGIDNPRLEESPQIGLSMERTEPLWVKWEAGDGDFIVITLTPGTGSQTAYGKLVCATEDDGCLRIPSSALLQLALDRAVNFKFRIGRYNRTVWWLEEGEEILAAADIEASAVLEAVVGR